MNKKVLIAPSILSADFGKINEEIALVESKVDLIHVDVMDGRFVPNITIGPPVVKKLKSSKPLDCHLMIVEPEKFVEEFVKAGAASITVHVEACPHLHRVIQQIKSCGVKAAVALNPATSLNSIEDVLDELDMVLLMTVNPGFGGQTFIESVLPKISKLRKLKPNLDIEVDGGINLDTVQKVVKAGANVLVAGNAIFGQTDRKKAIQELKEKLL